MLSPDFKIYVVLPTVVILIGMYLYNFIANSETGPHFLIQKILSIPAGGAFLIVFIPFCILFIIKLNVTAYIELPNKVTIFQSLPFIIALYALYVCFCLGVPLIANMRWLKLMLPLLITSLLLSFIFSSWSANYFESHNYKKSPSSNQDFGKKIFIQQYRKH